jgi:aryl-alcohol dehydrogenase-like predicted oxidoreductase
MEYRALGATGLLVSALGFGGNDLGRGQAPRHRRPKRCGRLPQRSIMA